MTQAILVQKRNYSADARRRMSEAHLGKPLTEEHKANISAGWTPERKAKQSAARIGRTLSEEHKAKLSASHTGKPRSEETKAKISAGWTPEKRTKKSASMTGENHPGFGKTLSEETRANIGAATKEQWKDPEFRNKMTGENHPRFNNWSSREPYCHLWDEPLRERCRNHYGRVCVLSDTLRSVMGSESGLDDFAGHEIFSGHRLSVHHIRGNKMEGCNGTELALVPLQGGFNSKKFDGLRLEDHPFYTTLFLLKEIERRHRSQQ